MKLDRARQKTDRLLEELEKDITKVYKKAAKDIGKKWNQYMAEGRERIATVLEDGDIDAYERVLRDYTLGNKYYQGMVKEVSRQLANTNKTALAYSNDRLPTIYAVNYNAVADNVKKLKGFGR